MLSVIASLFGPVLFCCWSNIKGAQTNCPHTATLTCPSSRRRSICAAVEAQMSQSSRYDWRKGKTDERPLSEDVSDQWETINVHVM